jgi:Domain of unknown function (DUF5658)
MLETGPPTHAEVSAPLSVLALAAIAIALHALDLISGLRMILVYGLNLEQNPLARAIFQAGGPLGLTAAKLAVVGAGVVVLVLIGRARPRLAHVALTLVALLGLLGFASNLV